MRRMLTTAATLVLVTSAPGLVSSAFAHGGSYRGPAGEVPANSREPSDPPPPPEGGGPQTPGGDNPGGPTTGGGDTGGPTTGGGSGPTTGGSGPSTGGGGGPTTGGPAGGPKTGKKAGPGYDDWVFWWNYNKDEILQLKSRVKGMSRGPLTGRRGSGKTIVNATDAAIQEKIVPTLRALLDSKDISFHIQSAAELGLAKIGDESIVQTLEKMARNENKEFHNEVEESATLALGLLQKDSAEVRSFLIEMIKDGKRDASFVRPFSAVSLGLLGDKNDKDGATQSAMFDVLSRKENKDEIKPSCLLALGLMSNDKALPELFTMLTTRKTSAKGSEELSDVDMSYVIQALGKIGRQGLADEKGKETAIVDEMMKLLEKDKAKLGVNSQRSAAIALGQIAPQCDGKLQSKIVERLKEVIDEGSTDSQERNFAVMALGRIGATKGIEEKTRTETVRVLGETLKKGRGLTPPFAGLALGLVGQTMTEEGKTPEEEIRAPIREKFKEGHDRHEDAKQLGAYAIASGLVHDVLAVPELKAVLLEKNADKRLRGYCALGLGMINTPDVKDAIKETLKTADDRDLRVQTAVAAGLIQDASVIDELLTILKDKNSSQYELGSAALALGQIGDESAIDKLVEIAKDEKKQYPDLTRALATVALGQIGDRRDVPTLSRAATDINYRAHVAAITELLTIL